MFLSKRFVLAVWLTFISGLAYAQTSFPTADTAATFLLRVTWVDDKGPQQTFGTGVTVDASGTVLTAKHILPSSPKTQSVEVLAFTGPGAPQPSFSLSCTPVEQADIAFCTPSGSTQPFPYPAKVTFSSVSESQPVWVRGYPKGGPLEGAPGQIRLVESPFARTSALIRVGYSGGPVYANGNIVGIVHDGEPVSDNKNDPTMWGQGRFTLLKDVQSYIPATMLTAMTNAQSNAEANISAWEKKTEAISQASAISYAGVAPTAIDLGILGSVVFPMYGAIAGSATKPKLSDKAQINLITPPPPYQTSGLPEILTTAYSINETNDSHGVFPSKQTYTTGQQKATPGYKIVRYELEKISDNHLSDEEFILAEGGGAIEYKYSLKSGPLIDRYRGWLKARLLVTEQKK